MRNLAQNIRNMNYRRINLLYILKFLILGILIFACCSLNNYLSDLHKTELNKNLKFEEKFIGNNLLKKLELQRMYRDKEERFDDYLHYFFLTVLFGITIITFVNGKINSENEKLDELEKEA